MRHVESGGRGGRKRGGGAYSGISRAVRRGKRRNVRRVLLRRRGSVPRGVRSRVRHRVHGYTTARYERHGRRPRFARGGQRGNAGVRDEHGTVRGERLRSERAGFYSQTRVLSQFRDEDEARAARAPFARAAFGRAVFIRRRGSAACFRKFGKIHRGGRSSPHIPHVRRRRGRVRSARRDGKDACRQRFFALQ